MSSTAKKDSFHAIAATASAERRARAKESKEAGVREGGRSVRVQLHDEKKQLPPHQIPSLGALPEHLLRTIVRGLHTTGFPKFTGTNKKMADAVATAGDGFWYGVACPEVATLHTQLSLGPAPAPQMRSLLMKHINAGRQMQTRDDTAIDCIDKWYPDLSEADNAKIQRANAFFAELMFKLEAKTITFDEWMLQACRAPQGSRGYSMKNVLLEFRDHIDQDPVKLHTARKKARDKAAAPPQHQPETCLWTFTFADRDGERTSTFSAFPTFADGGKGGEQGEGCGSGGFEFIVPDNVAPAFLAAHLAAAASDVSLNGILRPSTRTPHSMMPAGPTHAYVQC